MKMNGVSSGQVEKESGCICQFYSSEINAAACQVPNLWLYLLSGEAIQVTNLHAFKNLMSKPTTALMQSCLQGQSQQRTKATEEGTAGRMSPDLLAQLHPLKPWLPVSTS